MQSLFFRLTLLSFMGAHFFGALSVSAQATKGLYSRLQGTAQPRHQTARHPHAFNCASCTAKAGSKAGRLFLPTGVNTNNKVYQCLNNCSLKEVAPLFCSMAGHMKPADYHKFASIAPQLKAFKIPDHATTQDLDQEYQVLVQACQNHYAHNPHLKAQYQIFIKFMMGVEACGQAHGVMQKLSTQHRACIKQLMNDENAQCAHGLTEEDMKIMDAAATEDIATCLLHFEKYSNLGT